MNATYTKFGEVSTFEMSAPHRPPTRAVPIKVGEAESHPLMNVPGPKGAGLVSTGIDPWATLNSTFGAPHIDAYRILRGPRRNTYLHAYGRFSDHQV